jgi:hypothetical protein
MNVREGTRRLGIVLSLCGTILGGYLEHGYARAVWHNYRAAKRFESLRASPAIQKVAEAIKEYKNGPLATYPWINYRFNRQSRQLEYQADIKRLLADPRFLNLDAPSQKTVLSQIDSRFSGLSNSDLQSLQHLMAPIAVEADAVNSRKLGIRLTKAARLKFWSTLRNQRSAGGQGWNISDSPLNRRSRSEDRCSSPHGIPSPVTVPTPRFSAALGRCSHTHMDSGWILCISHLNTLRLIALYQTIDVGCSIRQHRFVNQGVNF